MVLHQCSFHSFSNYGYVRCYYLRNLDERHTGRVTFLQLFSKSKSSSKVCVVVVVLKENREEGKRWEKERKKCKHKLWEWPTLTPSCPPTLSSHLPGSPVNHVSMGTMNEAGLPVTNRSFYSIAMPSLVVKSIVLEADKLGSDKHQSWDICRIISLPWGTLDGWWQIWAFGLECRGSSIESSTSDCRAATPWANSLLDPTF